MRDGPVHAAPTSTGNGAPARTTPAPVAESPSPGRKEPDVRAVERRARGMAEGLRVVLERSRDGARSLGELSADDPRLRSALEQAGADEGRRIWFLGRSGRRLWPDEMLCVAGCYETLAEAAALAACAVELRELDDTQRLRAYELVAEAQSALRKAVRDLAGLRRSDEDRAALFEWLQDHVADEGLYVRRHMRARDLADPWAWRERRARLRALRCGPVSYTHLTLPTITE